jgi:hypothetical protein
MTQPIDYQVTPGRQAACCPSMRMALFSRYIRKGFLWRKHDLPRWFPWRLEIKAQGGKDVSPIHFCPFCGANLDERGD